MQYRHFGAIARAVSAYSKAHGQRVFMPEELAEYLADEISQFNENFNRQRFIDACKPVDTWPKWIDGVLTYACCVSAFGQPCNHK